MDITVIIPAYNCQQELDHTLRNFPDVNKVEIIVIDDGSLVPIKDNTFSGAKIIRLSHNNGVGTAFDIGVKNAQTNNIILMGADVIPEMEWLDKATSVLENHPMALTCAICSGFNKNKALFRDNRPRRYGAYILSQHERKTNGLLIRDIIQAKWNRGTPEWEGDVGRIGCILGAFYITTKTLYNNIGGWMGHKHWGGLEPMISLRAKRSGYPLFASRYLEAAHHFGRTTVSERPPQWPTYFYNKILMAETMFENPSRAYEYLFTDGGNNWVHKGQAMVNHAKKIGIVQDIRQFHKQNWVNGLIKNDEEL
jgi:glycosyltransferase involved in cell wall biosynthesis